MRDFFCIAEQRGVICVGGGKNLEKICHKYRFSQWIVGVIDNKKAGKKFSIDGRELLIAAPEDISLFGGAADNAVMIITTSFVFVYELICQLDSLEIYNNRDVYVYSLLQTPDNYEIPTNRLKIIPKKIHYCWFGRSPIPKEFLDNIDSWRKFCPDYEIIRWDETNYDIGQNLYMKEAYEAQKWGFVPDFARLDIINRHGGIYLDTDVEMVKSFEPLRIYQFFCGFQPDNRVALGLGFGGVCNNKFISAFLEIYKDLYFVLENGKLNQTVSPEYSKEVIERLGFVSDGRTQEINGGIIFSSEFFSPLYGLTGALIGEVTNNTFSIHKYAGTWLDDNERREKYNVRKKEKDEIERVTNRIVDKS